MVRLLVVLAALCAASPAAAQCRLALILALDVSSSVDGREDRLQRDGLAGALLSPEIVAAFLETPETPVALAVYEWSGRYQQHRILDWTVMDSRAAILGAAEAIGGSTRSFSEFPTAVGYAIGHAATVFRDGPDCLFRTLDLSGDGVNNEGFGPLLAYRHFPLDDVTVNGLAIGGAAQGDKDLFEFFRNDVIKGPGAFVEIARNYDDFERAMRRKLLRELRARVIGELDGADTRG